MSRGALLAILCCSLAASAAQRGAKCAHEGHVVSGIRVRRRRRCNPLRIQHLRHEQDHRHRRLEQQRPGRGRLGSGLGDRRLVGSLSVSRSAPNPSLRSSAPPPPTANRQAKARGTRASRAVSASRRGPTISLESAAMSAWATPISAARKSGARRSTKGPSSASSAPAWPPPSTGTSSARPLERLRTTGSRGHAAPRSLITPPFLRAHGGGGRARRASSARESAHGSPAGRVAGSPPARHGRAPDRRGPPASPRCRLPARRSR